MTEGQGLELLPGQVQHQETGQVLAASQVELPLLQQDMAFNPHIFLENIEKSQPGVYPLFMNRMVRALVGNASRDTSAVGRFVIFQFDGTTVAGKTNDLLAGMSFLNPDVDHPEYLDPTYREHLEKGGLPIDIVYTHIMDDVKIAIELKEELGLEADGYPAVLGHLTDFHYRKGAQVTSKRRELVRRHRRKDRSTLLVEDMIGITALPTNPDLTLETRGPERGAISDLMLYIAENVPVFLGASNLPEDKKGELLEIRDKVSKMPLNRIIPYLKRKGIRDSRKDPAAIRRSYQESGDDRLLFQQLIAIADNVHYLAKQDELLGVLDPEMAEWSVEDYIAYFMYNPSHRQNTLSAYIPEFQRRVLMTQDYAHPRAVFLQPGEIREVRDEDRGWIDRHNLAQYLETRLEETNDPDLKNHTRFWRRHQ